MSSLENNSPEIAAGTVLAGKYRIDEVLGRGGMGVVVAATHLVLDQRVALKFLLPSALESGEAAERFAREARAAVRLRSEHVARVLDVGQMENGAPFMVMEFLEGNDLAERIARGPITVGEAVDYVLQASEAVAEAHALGIIHRDLKPRNLFLTSTVHGKPLIKVLDFGISKSVGPGSAEELSLTRTSAIMGSPNYMSPEQLATPRNVDGRSDVWSLGVILYELLAGRVPFQAATITELCARVFQEEPDPLNTLRLDVSPTLAEVVHRALAKKLDQRYPNVQELARALAPFAPDPSIAERVINVTVESRASLPGTNAPRSAPSSARAVTPSRASLPQVAPAGQFAAGTSVSWSDGALPDLAASASGLSGAAGLPTTTKRRTLALLAAVGAIAVTAGIATLLAVSSSHSTGTAAGVDTATSSSGVGRVIEVSSPNPPSTALATDAGALTATAPSASASAAAPVASATTTATAATVATATTATPATATATTATPRPANPTPRPQPHKPTTHEDNNLADDRH